MRRIRVYGQVFFLILLAVGVVMMPMPAKAQAGWLSNWTYRIPVTVTNTAGTSLSNFQVRVTLNGSFSFANAKSDGSDLRFTSSDGTTMIPFWVESWTPGSSSASVWVQVPSLPITGATIYLYYGNTTAVSISNGDSTFEFFDNFESSSTATQGYFQLGSPQTILVQDQSWENFAPHTLSVLPLNSGGFTYWGYYALQEGCGGVGLARSNDLNTWTKLAEPSNPLFTNGRWPSVIQASNKIYMVYNKDYCLSADSIVLASSTDGLNFTTVKTLVPQGYKGNLKNHNPTIFLNPNDNKHYLYWASFDTSSLWTIWARSATTPEGLDTTTADVNIMSLNSSTAILAAPDMMYYNGTYYLSTEVFDPNTQTWLTNVYGSTTSPTGGFTLLQGNPVLSNGGACMFQHIFGATLHVYYCQQTNGVWTVAHRSAALNSTTTTSIDGTKWTAGGGNWSVLSDTQQDGTTGKVLRGSTSSRQILYSTYSGTDYVVEAFGKQVQGNVWGLGVRVNDPNNLYSVNLYEGLDTTQNLFMYNWTGGTSTSLGSAAVGTVNPNTWYKLTVKASGSGFDVHMNDVFRFHTADGGFGAGRVALYGESGTLANFNNVLVRKFAAADPTTVLGTVQSAANTALVSVTVSTGSVIGGNPVTGTVNLSAPAPLGGVVVTLSSNNAAATVPANVMVGAGATSATFNVTTSVVAATASATIGGTYNSVTQSAALSINPLLLLSVTMNPNSVAGGSSSTGTVTLNAPAVGTAAQRTVALGDNSTSATTPASVTVATGATTATFTVTTTAVSTSTTVTITGSLNSSTKTATLTIAPAATATPTFNPVAGAYASSVSVTISDATAGAVIYYTTNGTTPTTSSSVYSVPIVVSSTTTIQAMATSSGNANSAVASATYTIGSATLTLGRTTIGTSTDSGDSNYMNLVRVVTGTQGGAVSGCSVNVGAVGAAPSNQWQCALYSDSGGNVGTLIAASASGTLTANSWNTVLLTATIAPNTAYWIGYNSNGADNVNNFKYDNVAGTVFRYQVQAYGTWPAAPSTVGPLTLQPSLYLTYTGGPVLPATATPTFNPVAGAYASSVSVTISDATAGAVIYYTTNGTTPTTSSSVYSVPIVVSSTTTIQAMATSSGNANSAVASATYTIGSATLTLGRTTIGTSTDSGDSNYMNLVRVVTGTQGGAVSGCSVNVGAVGAAPSNQWQCALYSDSGGNVGTLIAASASGTLTANSWNTVLLTATIAPNTAYWIGYNSNGADNVNNFKYDNVAGTVFRYQVQAYGTWPAAPSTVGPLTLQPSLYLTYTAGP